MLKDLVVDQFLFVVFCAQELMDVLNNPQSALFISLTIRDELIDNLDQLLLEAVGLNAIFINNLEEWVGRWLNCYQQICLDFVDLLIKLLSGFGIQWNPKLALTSCIHFLEVKLCEVVDNTQ